GPRSRRRSSPPRGAAMNTLREVVAALERGQLLVEMPDLHTWPEITGLTADSRKVERGMLYCAVHGSARDGHEFVAAARERGATMEVSSHSLDQGRVEGLVFRAAVFTNLTRDHLDYHKTLEDYFRAKAKLVQYLAPDGLEVVNADDPAWLRLRREHRRVTFGERGGDVTAARVTLDAAGARFDLVTPMGRAEVRLPLLGRFNVANALGVAA